MWPFKKKKQEELISKYKMREQVTFRHRGDMAIGFVSSVYRGEDAGLLYDVQIGGECPTVIHGIKEEELRPYEPYKGPYSAD